MAKTEINLIGSLFDEAENLKGTPKYYGWRRARRMNPINRSGNEKY
jgi:hypothetical protein